MRTPELDSAIASLRRAGSDTARIEVKSAADGIGKSLWPTISAFSNTEGGMVILGLDEGTGFAPVPGFDANRVLDQLQDVARPRLAHERRGPLTPTPIMSVDRARLEGADVVVAHVEPATTGTRPCYVTDQGMERGSYIRIADGDHRLDSQSVFFMRMETEPSPADSEPVAGTTLDDLDETLVRRMEAMLRTSRPRALAGTRSTQEILERVGALDRVSGAPTLAGLLALGRYPQQFMPQLMIGFASYPGGDKADFVEGPRMLDRAVCEGPIPDMVDDAVAAVVKNLRAHRVSRGAGAEDVLEIPVEAIREAIVNAVTHRDYSELTRGDQVRVELFPDRLEVHSPGGLWGGRGMEHLFDGESRSRNRVLAKLAMNVPFRDRDETLCENAGSGIPRMLAVMTANGLPAPRFPPSPALFTTVLDRFGVMNPHTRAWLDAIAGGTLPRVQRFALALMRQAGDLTAQQLRLQLAIDTTIAESALEALAGAGYATCDNGVYHLSARATRKSSSTVADRILGELERSRTLSVRQLAELLDRSPASLRPVLRDLVDSGAIIATAPPTSRRRAYRLPG